VYKNEFSITNRTIAALVPFTDPNLTSSQVELREENIPILTKVYEKFRRKGVEEKYSQRKSSKN